MNTDSKKKLHYGWIVMIGCCFLQAGGLGGVLNTAGVFLVPITDSLGFGRAEFAMWLTILYFSSSIAMPIIAKFLNEKNFKLYINASMLIMIAAFAATAFYTEMWQWYVSGLIIGVVGAFNLICMTPILLENWFHKRAGMAIGIAMAFSAVGGAVFAFLTTELIAVFGDWRTAMLVISGIIFILTMPWTIFVFHFKPAALGLLPYGYEEDSRDDAASPQKIGRPAGVPFKRAVFTFAFVALFIFAGEDALFGGYNSNMVGIALVAGLSELDGATMLSLGMIGCVIFSALMGIVADKWGAARPTYISFAIVAVCFVVFIFAKNQIVLYIAAFFFGMSGIGVAVCIPLLIAEIFGKRDYAQIFALTRMGTGIIGSFGPTLIALSFDMTASYTAAFVGGIIALVMCRFLVFAAIKWSRKIPWEPDEITGDNGVVPSTAPVANN